MIDPIASFFEDAKDLSPSPLSGKPNWEALLEIFTSQTQLADDVTVDLIVNRTVDLATGDTLDVLGRIVGQPRADLVDDTYRSYIRARIAATSSQGTWEDLINVVSLALNDDTITIELGQSNYKTVLLSLGGTTITTDTINAVLADLLSIAKAAGDRVLLYPDEEDAWLFGGDPTTLDGAVLAAATTINVDDTSGFDDSGEGVVRDGTDDIFSYTGKTSSEFTGVTGLTSGHSSGASVQQYDYDVGFGDTADALAGGSLAEVL